MFETLDPEVRDRLKGNAEIRGAVYRKIPVEIRHLIKNIRDHDDADFEDTWETICERLTEQAHLSQKAAPAVRAFSAHLNKKPRRDDIVASPQIQKQRNLNTPSYEATFLTATMAPEDARSILRQQTEPKIGGIRKTKLNVDLPAKAATCNSISRKARQPFTRGKISLFRADARNAVISARLRASRAGRNLPMPRKPKPIHEL